MKDINQIEEATIGDLTDLLDELREEKRGYESKIKDINKNYQLVEERLIEIMEENGLEQVKGQRASASLSVKPYPQVKDKEAFYNWALQGGRFEFLQARVNSAPVIEMLENENELPDGIELFTKKRINLRSIK